MGKKKKSSKQDKALQTIILLTAITNLIHTVIEIIKDIMN